MVLLINMPDETYQYITGDKYDEHLDRRFDFQARHAIANGIPIQKEAAEYIASHLVDVAEVG